VVAFESASAAVEGMLLLLGTACGNELFQQVVAFHRDIIAAVIGVIKSTPDADVLWKKATTDRYNDLIEAFRKELETSESNWPQSTESSAAPSPGQPTLG
jgi:hypothetical protein